MSYWKFHIYFLILWNIVFDNRSRDIFNSYMFSIFLLIVLIKSIYVYICIKLSIVLKEAISEKLVTKTQNRLPVWHRAPPGRLQVRLGHLDGVGEDPGEGRSQATDGELHPRLRASWQEQLKPAVRRISTVDLLLCDLPVVSGSLICGGGVRRYRCGKATHVAPPRFCERMDGRCWKVGEIIRWGIFSKVFGGVVELRSD